MADDEVLHARESPSGDGTEDPLRRMALDLARDVTNELTGLVEENLNLRRKLRGVGGTHMDERWAREMETRMVRVETEIKTFAPVAMVREMIEPLQDGVKELTYSVKELTASDLELKELHKGLMVERAKQEQEKHEKELESKQAEIELLKAQKAKTGTLVFITQKAQPVTSFIIAVAAIVGIFYGFFLWWSEHFKK